MINDSSGNETTERGTSWKKKIWKRDKSGK